MYPAYPADPFPTLIVMRRRTAILAAVALATGATVAEGAGSSRPRVGGCTVFPASNPWNQRVDKLPVAGNSDAIVRSIGVSEGMHADLPVAGNSDAIVRSIGVSEGMHAD